MSFDVDGYPTEETLDKIKKMDLIPDESFEELLKIVCSHWRWSDSMFFILDRQKGCLELHTGGWSGNEDIIRALRNNMLFWDLCWYKSKRGGHFWFDIRRYVR